MKKVMAIYINWPCTVQPDFNLGRFLSMLDYFLSTPYPMAFNNMSTIWEISYYFQIDILSCYTSMLTWKQYVFLILFLQPFIWFFVGQFSPLRQVACTCIKDTFFQMKELCIKMLLKKNSLWPEVPYILLASQVSTLH